MKQQTVNEAYDDYMLHARSMGQAANTLANKRSGLRPFLQKYGNYQLHNITSNHIAEFFLDTGRRRQPSSLDNLHSILATFFTFCVDTGRLKSHLNPMYARQRPRYADKEKVRIPPHRFPELLLLADEHDARDRALVAMGLFTMLRDQEMASIRIRDVDLVSGHIKVVITKSHMEDRVPISADLDVELRRWYKAYQERIGALKPDYLLLPALVKGFLRTPDGRMAQAPVRGYQPFKPLAKTSRVVTPLLSKMGYATENAEGKSLREGSHTLRRSGARALYDYLVGIGRADALRVVQTMLHHANAEQTQHYIGLHADRITRDDLMIGVSIFGFDKIPMIGGMSHGEAEGDDPRLRQMR